MEKMESWEVKEIILKLTKLLDSGEISDLIDEFYELLK